MNKATAPTTKLGMPTPSPVANAVISNLLSPLSSFSSAPAVLWLESSVAEADGFARSQPVLCAVACVVARMLS